MCQRVTAGGGYFRLVGGCQGRPAEKVTFKLRHRCQERTSHVKTSMRTFQERDCKLVERSRRGRKLRLFEKTMWKNQKEVRNRW